MPRRLAAVDEVATDADADAEPSITPCIASSSSSDSAVRCVDPIRLRTMPWASAAAAPSAASAACKEAGAGVLVGAL